MIKILPGDLWITPIMEFFTWLGYPQAYMIVIAIIFWSVDRKLGLRMALFLPVVSNLNGIMKQAFHAPRPYWVDPGVRAIHVSNGFGMPSGHAQAATVWLYAATLLKNRRFWALAIIIALFVGMSRVYLGVHFFSQVVVGWLIGILIVILFVRLESPFLLWFLIRKPKNQIFLLLGISVLFLVLGGIFVILMADWEMPAVWISNAADDLGTSHETILTSIGLSAVAGNTGGFLGVSLGALLLYRINGFEVAGKWWIRILRSVAGLSILIALYAIIHLAEPGQDSKVLYSIWRFSGFFLISFSAIFLVPVLLKRTILLNASTAPKDQ